MATENQIVKIADVIQPQLFAQYVLDYTTERSKLIASGITASNPLLDQIITGGGTTLTMPKWNDLTGESQVLSDKRDIMTDKITTRSEVATFIMRANAWQTHELAGALAASDPMQAIVQLVGNWWVRDEQRILLNVLKGVFASASMADLKHGDGTKLIDAAFVLDAKQRLGDMADQLTAMAMHSAVYTHLQKANLIDFIPQSDGKVVIPRFLGYNVIIDDGMPVTDGVYKTYLFANGVIARAQGTPLTMTPVETDRNSLGSSDILINRKAMVLHPMGISWLGTGKIADATPTNLELATGTNWNRVSDVKKIGIVEMSHKIAI